MISLAQVVAPGAMFVQGDAMAMDFADNSLEAVSLGLGVPHFPDPSRGLAEAAAVLNRAGESRF